MCQICNVFHFFQSDTQEKKKDRTAADDTAAIAKQTTRTTVRVSGIQFNASRNTGAPPSRFLRRVQTSQSGVSFGARHKEANKNGRSKREMIGRVGASSFAGASERLGRHSFCFFNPVLICALPPSFLRTSRTKNVCPAAALAVKRGRPPHAGFFFSRCKRLRFRRFFSQVRTKRNRC